MKKNKTTKPSKKSYSSVKEILKDNNSKIKLTPFNCKEAKFGKTLTISNPSCLDGKFDVIFRRASTSEKFFGDMEKQRPNQILWNEEEQQAYFLNPDKQLYKILFEPIDMEKIREGLSVDYVEDNYFSELKDFEIMRERISMLDTISSHIGKYYSDAWVRSNVLNQSSAEIERMNDEIAKEKSTEESGSETEGGGDFGDSGSFAGIEDNSYIEDTRKEEIHEAQLKMIESMTKILEE